MRNPMANICHGFSLIIIFSRFYSLEHSQNGMIVRHQFTWCSPALYAVKYANKKVANEIVKELRKYSTI